MPNSGGRVIQSHNESQPLAGQLGADLVLQSVERRLAGIENWLEQQHAKETPVISGGGSGAPAGAQYVVMALHAGLTDERVLTGGNGLSLADGGAGGNATLSVGPGTLISVGAATVGITAAGVAGTFIRAGAGLAAEWSTLVLPNAATTGDILVATGANTVGSLVDVAAGKPLLSGGAGALPVYAPWGLVGTAGQTYTFPAASGAVPTGAGTLTVSTINDATIANHTHAITSSSNPGAAASILATSASGYLQLARLGINVVPLYRLHIDTTSSTAIYNASRWSHVAGSKNANYMYAPLTPGAASSAVLHNLMVQSYLAPSAGAHTGSIYSVYFQSYTGGAQNLGRAYGVGGHIEHYGTGTLTAATGGIFSVTAKAGCGNISDAIGQAVQINNASTATIARAYGLYIASATNSGGGAITTNYGIYILNQTVGGTNYAIYTTAGLNRLGDQLSVVGSADRQQLIVTGFTTQTDPVAQIYDGVATSGAVRYGLDIMRTVAGAGALAANDGIGLRFSLETATSGTNQVAATIAALWNDPANATFKGDLVAHARDSAGAREIWRGRGSGAAAMLSFYGGTPVVRGAALTAQLTTITHTAPGAPDYAVQDMVDVSIGAGWAFANHDEANTVLSVIANLQVRVAELEARLNAATGVNLIA